MVPSRRPPRTPGYLAINAVQVVADPVLLRLLGPDNLPLCPLLSLSGTFRCVSSAHDSCDRCEMHASRRWPLQRSYTAAVHRLAFPWAVYDSVIVQTVSIA